MVNRACFEHYCGLSKNQQPIWAAKNKSGAFVSAQRFATLLLFLLGCLFITGCGGDEDEGKSLVPAQPVPTADGSADGANPDGTSPDGTTEGETNPDGTPKDPEGEGEKNEDPMPMEEKPEEPAEPEEPPRPAEVKAWKTEHYLSAKRDGDRHLLEAVNFMGEKFAGDARAAGLFKKLLLIEHEPGPKLSDGSEGPDVEISVNLPIADVLVKALGKNNTPESTMILKEMLLGKIETPIEGLRGVNAVVNALTANLDNQANEDLIFDLITNTKETIGDGKLGGEDSMDPRRFQSNLTSTLSQIVTTSLCNRLAKHLDDPQVSQELASQLETLLIPDRPESLQAKMIVYQNKQTEKRTKSTAEAALNKHSEIALAMLLGIPPKLEALPEPGALSRPSRRQAGYTDEEIKQEMEFAQFCWTPEFNDYLNVQLKKAASPDQLPGVVQLLSSMPTDFGRFSVSEMLSYHAYRGPRYWSASGLLGRVPTDPGFVVMAKQIYHGSSRRNVRVDKDDIRPTVDQAAKEQWQDGADALVRGWIQKMYSAAQNSDAEEQLALRDKGNFKVNLHPDARVVAEYHLTWPGETQSMIPSVKLAPVEIHYIRIEEEATLPEKMEKYYKRYGGGVSSPTHNVRNGFWFDDLANGSTPRSKVSIDIQMNHKPIVEDPKARGVGNDPKPIPVSIDILTIEIPEVTEPEGS